MEYQNLGRTGIKVSRLCLGMMTFGNAQSWMLELDDAKPIVDRALDAGINFFDTANVYSRGRSEEITGELLKDHRDDVVIATKVRFAMGEGHNDSGLNRYHIQRQIDASL
ncbi:MAG: aldo/keto reductase, partial [Candidatus Kariarchaeaceae archaeon]